jgi:sulfur-oxidizing protein SoxB
MKALSPWLSSVLAAALIACSAPLSAATITILHYNDLHAHLTPHLDRVPDGPSGRTATGTRIVARGGIARLATLVKRIRAQNPAAVLINVGDTYHGGVEALFTLGNAIVDPVNALGIDVGVPGNWDYAYGPMVTRLRYATLAPMEAQLLARLTNRLMPAGPIRRPTFPNLAANVHYTFPLYKRGDAFLPATWMTERAGVKLGFIGISSDIVPRMSEQLAMGLDFLAGEANYRKLIERHARTLRAQGARLVFVMSELGIHKDHQLAQVIAPGSVDVFFSAHTHEATFTPLTSASGALVVEAGNDGYLGRMDIEVAGAARPRFTWRLLPIDRTIPEDPQMRALVAKARAPFLVAHPNIKLPMPYVDLTLTQPITTVVGYSKGPLDRRDALDNTFNRVFASLVRQTAGTQLAMTPGFRFDSVIASPDIELEDNTIANGAITLEDVYRFFPVVYTLAAADVSGARLHAIVEEGLTGVYSRDAFRHTGGWFDGFAGLGVRVDLAADDRRRVRAAWLTTDGSPLSDADTYTIAGCTRPGDGAGVLCSHTGFRNVRPLRNPATGHPWTAPELFIDALAHGALPAADGANITDASGAAAWPAAAFVQPLWQDTRNDGAGDVLLSQPRRDARAR